MRTSLVAALIAVAVGADVAAAQEPSQVTGLASGTGTASRP